MRRAVTPTSWSCERGTTTRARYRLPARRRDSEKALSPLGNTLAVGENAVSSDEAGIFLAKEFARCVVAGGVYSRRLTARWREVGTRWKSSCTSTSQSISTARICGTISVWTTLPSADPAM